MAISEDEVLGKAYDSRLMRRLMVYLRPYRRQAILALVASIAGSMLQLVQPYLTKVAIDRYIAQGDLAGLNRLALMFLAVLLGSFTSEYVQTFIMQMIGQRIMFDMRMQIYRHLQRLDLAFYDRNPVGRLMTRVTSDVDVLNDLFTSGVITVFSDVFTLVGIMIVMLTMNWKLALVSFAVLPLIVLVTQWFRRNVRDSYRTVRLWIARINSYLQENIGGMTTVQLFHREDRNFARFDEIDKGHRDANIQSIFYYATFYPAIEVIGAVAVSLIIWYGGGRVILGALTLGSLVAFIQYSQRFFRPISDISEKFNLMQAAMASSERVFTLLDTPVVIESPARPKPPAESAFEVAQGSTTASSDVPSKGEGHVIFDHVWFAYKGEDYVLRDVSFEVKPGERVAIVGATGAGKSTIVNLLLRFYDVSRGRILVDGVDVREMDLNVLRGLFSLVLQDVQLFSGTIESNIRLGSDAITDEQVRAAAEAVHAGPFIERLPDGFKTPVAERGATLSVGQKQLLSFARALAYDPQILILDEATSSVDTETELLIRDALRVLMAGRTTIAIAHRLSTIQDMDNILVMHKAELRESGSHQQLLAKRGIYYRLYQLQYKDQEMGTTATTPSSSQTQR